MPLPTRSPPCSPSGPGGTGRAGAARSWPGPVAVAWSARFPAACRSGSSAASTTDGLGEPDPWIERGVREVDDDVGDDDRGRRDEDDADDDRQVLLADGVDR